MIICVYSSSSPKLPQTYYEAAFELGREIALRGHGMCFGGGAAGLMGASARGVCSCSGKLYGVIPEKLNVGDIPYKACTDMIVTKTMRERKQIMEDMSDAFIALPGGFGTLEEILEIITLKQLGYHAKPIVLLNHNGYYESLLNQFEACYTEGFANRGLQEAYFVANSVTEALDYLESYEYRELEPKYGFEKYS